VTPNHKLKYRKSFTKGGRERKEKERDFGTTFFKVLLFFV